MLRAGLDLDGLGFVPEEIHVKLQVGVISDVLQHDPGGSWSTASFCGEYGLMMVNMA